MQQQECAVRSALLMAGLVLWAAGISWGAETESLATPEEHWARGEIAYGDKWVPILTVFKDYQAARAELEAMTGKADAIRARQAEFQRQLSTVRNEGSAAERPIRMELGQARSKQRDYVRALEAKPPEKPVKRPYPPRPQRSTSSGSRRWGNISGSGTNSSTYNDNYDEAYERWRRQCEAIDREYEQLLQRYQQEMAEYKKKYDEARKEKPKVDAIIKECEAKLAAMGAEIEQRQAPLVDQAKAVSEDAQSFERQKGSIETRISALANALRVAPEKVRLRYGILEWDEVFYSFAELEKLYTETQAEIDRVRAELKEEYTKAGRPFPADWRHPQQQRMDSLKALLDKCRAAQAQAPAVATNPA